MVINQKTRFKDLSIYLKNNFGISIYSLSNKDLPGHDKQLFNIRLNDKQTEAVILDENSRIADIHDLLESCACPGLGFRNQREIKLLFDVDLKTAKNLHMSPDTDTRLVNTALNSSISILKQQALNSDLDWVYRILKKTVYKLQTYEEKLLIAKTISEICENSPDVSINTLYEIIEGVCSNDIERIGISKQMACSSSEKAMQISNMLLRNTE